MKWVLLTLTVKCFCQLDRLALRSFNGGARGLRAVTSGHWTDEWTGWESIASRINVFQERIHKFSSGFAYVASCRWFRNHFRVEKRDMKGGTVNAFKMRSGSLQLIFDRATCPSRLQSWVYPTDPGLSMIQVNLVESGVQVVIGIEDASLAKAKPTHVMRNAMQRSRHQTIGSYEKRI